MRIREIIESEVETENREGSTIELNYTVIMDDAPGPSIYKEELQLAVKPDPIISEIQEDSRVYKIGSKEAITIIVKICAKTRLAFINYSNYREGTWIQSTSLK